MKMETRACTEEFVNINGIDQYFAYYEDPGKPVVLFLHGGPGEANSPVDYPFSANYHGFTLVNWDQRGAGKTAMKNPEAFAKVDVMLDDLDQVIEHLRNKFAVEKVVLLGHSWGSILGTLYTLEHPEHIMAYVGVGQVVDMMENERVGFEELEKRVRAVGRPGDLAKLETFAGYPYPDEPGRIIKDITGVRKLQRKYRLAATVGLKFILMQLANPRFKIGEFVKTSKTAMKLSMGLLDELFAFSLYSKSRDYKVPVFYILGEDDRQTPSVVAERYFETLTAPVKEICLIKNAGHATPFDAPEEFYSNLRRVLEKVK